MEHAFYRYYAGYSSEFVKDAIAWLNLPSHGATILDPWNGSGTTTATVYEQRHRAIGFDANPAMVVVSRARIASTQASSIRALAYEIASLTAGNPTSEHPDEPLAQWLTPVSAAYFRALERAIHLCFDNSPAEKHIDDSIPSWLVEDASVLYTALFRALRSTISRFSASNPTWMKTPNAHRLRLRPPLSAVLSSFLSEVESLCNMLDRMNRPHEMVLRPKIDVALSQKLPLPDACIDGVITSPPYCTRIDYAVATRFELALLQRVEPTQFKQLRDNLMGTPTVWLRQAAPDHRWGDTCLATLSAIYSHESQASKTYYTRYFVQYFTCLYRSLEEISRVLKQNGRLIMVVQDSNYKQIHVNLQTIVGEMCQSLSMEHVDQFDFPKPLTMARLNRRSKKYRRNHSAIESAIVLRRN